MNNDYTLNIFKSGKMTEADLNKLRAEVVVGSAYLSDYENSFIPAEMAQEFFDGYVDYIIEIMTEIYELPETGGYCTECNVPLSPCDENGTAVATAFGLYKCHDCGKQYRKAGVNFEFEQLDNAITLSNWYSIVDYSELDEALNLTTKLTLDENINSLAESVNWSYCRW